MTIESSGVAPHCYGYSQQLTPFIVDQLSTAWKCAQGNLKRPGCSRINCGSSVDFITRMAWPTAAYAEELKPTHRGHCLSSTSAHHFISSTHACVHQLWKRVSPLRIKLVWLATHTKPLRVKDKSNLKRFLVVGLQKQVELAEGCHIGHGYMPSQFGLFCKRTLCLFIFLFHAVCNK